MQLVNKQTKNTTKKNTQLFALKNTDVKLREVNILQNYTPLLSL